MRRYLPRLVLTGALLSPLSSWALGLGEIRLNSALNQPFDAEIELISPTPEELASLKVGLASMDLFARYGIDRPAYLSSFDFSVGRSRDGRATIKVRSNRSITEPFVTLLVEARWARGRLVREYTVLLDPPVYMPSQSQPAPVTAPQAGAQTDGRIERAPQPEPERAVREEPLPQPESRQTTSSQASAPSAIGAGEYVVQRNDTLWRIASRINPGSPSTVNRTMIALYRANPGAFDGNINRLRAGAVLRIPDAAEIEAISASEAVAEVARHTAEWSAALLSRTTEETSRLRLVTPEETPTPPAASSTDEATTAARGAEAAPSSQEDRRLEVESPDLSAMQQGVAEAPVEAPIEAEPAVEEQAASEQEPAAAPETAPAPARRPQSQPAAPEESPSFFERIGSFAWVLIALGALLALVLVFIRRRREDTSLDSLDAIATTPVSDDFEPAAARRVAAPKVSEPEPFRAEDDFNVAFDEPASAAPAAREPETAPAVEAAAGPSIDDTLSSDTAIRLDQQDALAEADFHMAYGLYDQAADLVKIAIEREPARRDLKLKLLEIYFVWGNRDQFLETARDLAATRAEAAPGEWDKILIMGKQIAPEDPLFQGESSSGLADLVDVNLEGGENRVDVDLFAEPPAEPAGDIDFEIPSGEYKVPSSGSDVDILLDEPKSDGDDDATREFDPLARTQETPTIESPMLDRDALDLSGLNAEQTAEISLDDLGLDAEAIDHSGSLEDTTSLDRELGGDTVERERPLGDDEMTQLAPSLGSLDRTMQAPRPESFDVESTGTIYLDPAELGTGETPGTSDTVEQPRADFRTDVDATATMKAPSALDFDLSEIEEAAPSVDQTMRQPAPDIADAESFASDVFGDSGKTPALDLDVGDALTAGDNSPTNEQPITEMELSELEPVTMSEVGTKLDLARAYMDMGDPDGARSILEEVLQEGNPAQKQEANRLLEAIR